MRKQLGVLCALGLCVVATSGCPTATVTVDGGGETPDTGGTDAGVDAGRRDTDGGGSIDGGGGADGGGGGSDAGGGGSDGGGGGSDAGCTVSPACTSACDAARATCDGCVGSCSTTCDTTRTSCTSTCTTSATACRSECGSLSACRAGCSAVPAGAARDACLASCDACLPACDSMLAACNDACTATHTSCVSACVPGCVGAGGGSSCAAAATACNDACGAVCSGGTDAAVVLPDAAVVLPDAALLDAAVSFSFGSPLQVDFTSLYDVDTVASSTPGGSAFPPLSPLDGSHYVLMTATFAGSSRGVPDDGFYAANADHPAVQLGWADDSFLPNSVILNEPTTARTEVTLPILPAHFSHVQLYLLSTEGSSSVTFLPNYADGLTGTLGVVIPDWFTTPSAPVFVVQSNLGRWDGTFRDPGGGRLMGTDIAVDSARTLVSITVRTTGPGRLVLYGATAY